LVDDAGAVVVADAEGTTIELRPAGIGIGDGVIAAGVGEDGGGVEVTAGVDGAVEVALVEVATDTEEVAAEVVLVEVDADVTAVEVEVALVEVAEDVEVEGEVN
jgi:hypothetical protein